MAAAGATSFIYPQTVEEVFKDYKGRHDAVMKALTTDLDDFFRQCAPDKENLCLFGSPSGSWEVNVPPECVPPEFPEPTVGINFVRDGLEKHQWLYLVACHTDAWLLSVAFFFGSNVGLKKTHRKRLFNMINDLPTISEVVLENINTEKETKVTNPSSNDNSNSNAKRVKVDHDEAKEEYSDSLCGVCRKNDDEFWICCDTCNTWYHGRCVNITPEQAGHIDQYECPTCRSTKRPQP